MEAKKDLTDSRFYEIPIGMTNKEIINKINQPNYHLMFLYHQSDEFCPEYNSTDFLGIRCREYPNHLVLMPGWDPEVYERAEKLFRRLTDDEVKAYTANWPDCSETSEAEQPAAEQLEDKEAPLPNYGQGIIKLWRSLFRILTSLIVFNLGLIAGFWLLVFLDKAKPHEAHLYSIIFGLLAVCLLVFDFIVFRFYQSAKRLFGGRKPLNN